MFSINSTMSQSTAVFARYYSENMLVTAKEGGDVYDIKIRR